MNDIEIIQPSIPPLPKNNLLLGVMRAVLDQLATVLLIIAVNSIPCLMLFLIVRYLGFDFSYLQILLALSGINITIKTVL